MNTATEDNNPKRILLIEDGEDSATIVQGLLGRNPRRFQFDRFQFEQMLRRANETLEIFAKQSQPEGADPFESPTTREREVLQLTAEGRTSNEIACLLKISSRTVETHRANLMAKLHLTNQSEVIRFALRRGLLPLDG